MIINKVRLGHAANSSSTHSIVFLPEWTLPPREDLPREEGWFGWNEFVLKESENKMLYLAATFGERLVHELGQKDALVVMKELFPGIEWNSNWHVDHQSRIGLPMIGNKVDFRFIKDLSEYVSQENIYILGGNDNECGELDEWKYDEQEHFRQMKDTSFQVMQTGDWWTLYRRDNGTKIRFSFKTNPTEFVRSQYPELVDLKITDYCPFECSFCYQGSSKHGKHADLGYIKTVLETLAGMGTFEVAIGGGEPTLHPNFIEILEVAFDLGITPNFTTKRFPDSWSEELYKVVNKNCGAVAFSITTPDQVEEIADYDIYPAETSVQVVMDTLDQETLTNIIRTAKAERITLLLLGFKETGRGSDFSRTNNTLTKRMLTGRISVDTAFIAQYPEIVENISKLLTVGNEGTTSMYIDAVEKKYGKSSYHETSPLDSIYGAWIKCAE